MANKVYPIFAADGVTELIPVADAVFSTGRIISPEFPFGDCWIVFCDSLGNPVAAGGTFTWRSSYVPGQNLTASNEDSATTMASDVAPGNADAYTPASFNAPVIESSVTLQGITGATHFKAWHNRFN